MELETIILINYFSQENPLNYSINWWGKCNLCHTVIQEYYNIEKVVVIKINQITFILHIQGVFSLPGRGFHQRVTLISSVPMTLDDVIVHVRQFIIALVSVDGCCSFSDPVMMMTSSSVIGTDEINVTR